MNYAELVTAIRRQKSFLCVGLDTDPSRLPDAVQNTPDPVLYFNGAIISATKDFCVAYKVNTAFYEAQGELGWQRLKKTCELIPDTHFCILDAKRGDIGNTSTQYAKAFDKMGDAVTVAPYMGEDSVVPFLKNSNLWVILLALTSNQGSRDFQLQRLESGAFVFEQVLKTAQTWADESRLMFVVGATQTDYLTKVRALAPRSFLLVPGVGKQGGSLEEVIRVGKTEDIGLLINSSRSIIYASSEADFAEAAGREAEKVQRVMMEYLV